MWIEKCWFEINNTLYLLILKSVICGHFHFHCSDNITAPKIHLHWFSLSWHSRDGRNMWTNLSRCKNSVHIPDQIFCLLCSPVSCITNRLCSILVSDNLKIKDVILRVDFSDLYFIISPVTHQYQHSPLWHLFSEQPKLTKQRVLRPHEQKEWMWTYTF